MFNERSTTPDTCSGWPESVSFLTPNISMFPVNYGDTVEVKCKTGFRVTSGDAQITCSKGNQFAWTSPPVCTLGKKAG